MAEAPRRFNHRRIAGFAAEELQADEIRTFAGNKKTPSWVFVFDESFHQAASLFEARGLAGRRASDFIVLCQRSIFPFDWVCW